MEIQKSEPAEEMESESHEKDLADNLLHSKKNKTKETTRANSSGKVCEIEFENNMK